MVLVLGLTDNRDMLSNAKSSLFCDGTKFFEAQLEVLIKFFTLLSIRIIEIFST